MSGKPVLMVLYTNDAVEVRYSDQSRLHILPCGTSFTHHSQTDGHPVHGMSTVQQRSCFVTSQFRDKLAAALDFRNRFAERPFLCAELTPRDDIVNLYASIKQIAWPKTASKQHCELGEDGSVRITSVDEFASIILSPHRKDFTVCYLSLISKDKQRERVKVRKHKHSLKTYSGPSGRHDKEKSGEKHGYNTEAVHTIRNMPGDFRDTSETPMRNIHSKVTGNYPHEEDLNISPITQASFAGSPSGVSHASGSPVTPLDAIKDKDAKFRPFSTPTEEMENVNIDDDNQLPMKSARNKHYMINREGSFLGEDYKDSNPQQTNKIGEDYSPSFKTNPNKQYTEPNNAISALHNSDPWPERQDVQISGESMMRYPGSEDSGSSGRSDVTDTETRCSYCWVTRHISRDECPLTWSHVVKMAEHMAGNRDEFINMENSNQSQIKRKAEPEKLRKINKDKCVMSEVPPPLPLTCQGQHLHKGHKDRKVMNDGKDPLEDWTSLNQGCLKVVLVDGVIYRIVRLQTMNVVEVYPGDGSVLVSQGMSAHFFLHIIPGTDKVEERTYSVKSPPQTVAGSHSVKSLMNRAHRLLAHVRQEVNMASLNTGLCCWKHEEIQLEEPMSTVLLEDCTIPGYGKFTAMSNGQIRILFKDRTALDMTCDFSKRLKNCLDHSSVENSVMLSDKKIGICRLLLPNGHYQMVDVKQPGHYKKYIQMANEWTDWVNSSPTERGSFYKNRLDNNMNVCVDRELQKIKCFNYVVDNTVLNRQSMDISGTSAFRPYGDSAPSARPGILRNIEQNKSNSDACSSQTKSHTVPSRSVQIHSPPQRHSGIGEGHRSMESESANQSSSSAHVPPISMRLNPIGQCQPMSFQGQNVLSNSIGQIRPNRNFESRESSRLASLEGFNAVRQALLKTSNVIKDLDSFLDKR